MFWATVGLPLCLALSLIAAFRSGQPHSGYYASDLYGMSSRTHARYGAAFAVGAVLFAVAIFVRAVPVVVLLAAFTLMAVFYLSSFARGFEDN